MHNQCCQFGLVFALVVALGHCVYSQCDTLSNGGYIQKDLTISIDQSPCDVKRTAIIAKGHKLIVNPGVELRFAAGVMLAVNGTLLAKVS
jgi:hypothetical protein